jgi:phosphatidylglycerol:prolipoprotein diacylglycerol transferase
MLLLAENTDIMFPGLGITLKNVGSSFTIGGFEIAYYGCCIAIAMVMGYLVAEWQAKRTGQNPEMYLDFAIIAIVVSVICARLYYVAFDWDAFKGSPLKILNLRTGGLAIYGGILGGIGTCIVFTKIKKQNFLNFADTACVGLLTGQIIGRWGNFFNREAFGSYASGFTRMLINVKNTSWYFDPSVSEDSVREAYAGKTAALNRILEIRNNAVILDGETYISVHPTFLYESVLNLILLIIILLYTKKKKVNGELFFMYVGGYGLIRVFLEGIRSDQLLIWGTGIPISQVLAGLMFLASVLAIVILRKKNKKISTSENPTV